MRAVVFFFSKLDIRVFKSSPLLTKKCAECSATLDSDLDRLSPSSKRFVTFWFACVHVFSYLHLSIEATSFLDLLGLQLIIGLSSSVVIS